MISSWDVVKLIGYVLGAWMLACVLSAGAYIWLRNYVVGRIQ